MVLKPAFRVTVCVLTAEVLVDPVLVKERGGYIDAIHIKIYRPNIAACKRIPGLQLVGTGIGDVQGIPDAGRCVGAELEITLPGMMRIAPFAPLAVLPAMLLKSKCSASCWMDSWYTGRRNRRDDS